MQIQYKLFFLISSLLFMVTACQPEKPVPQVMSGNEALLPDQKSESAASAVKAEDDFSDLKAKKDEQCDTEEELKAKKIEKPQEAFKLQGGDGDCKVD